jgi:beta-phosphoglucomutase-like phosphatase (HAD superfamily)
MTKQVDWDRERWAMPPVLEHLLHDVCVVLWDFDGVVANTEPAQQYSYSAVLADFGYIPEPNFFASLIGNSEPEIWNSLLRQFDMPASIEELIARRAEIYLPQAMLTIEPNDFVRPMLEYSRRRGILNIIVSSGGFSNISQLLTYWGLIDAFVDIYCRESPYHLDLTTKLERLRHAIEHRTGPMAIVEDSQEILRLAKMMGLRTIGVRHDLNDAEEINADFVIDCR